MFESLTTRCILWLSEQTGWQEWLGVIFREDRKLKENLTPGQAVFSRRHKGLSPAPPGTESAKDFSGHLILYLVAVSVPAPASELELISLHIYGWHFLHGS